MSSADRPYLGVPGGAGGIGGGLDRTSRIALVSVGMVLLFIFTWTGVAFEPGEQLCGVCNGLACTGSTPICPYTYFEIGLVLVTLAFSAALLAVGLSPAFLSLFRSQSRANRRLAGTSSIRTVTEFLAPFLSFYGWAITAWGLMVPLDLFILCHQSCSPPYELQGIPLLLVESGGALLSAGVVLLGVVALLHRADRRTAPVVEGSTLRPS